MTLSSHDIVVMNLDTQRLQSVPAAVNKAARNNAASLSSMSPNFTF